jgi:tetratricopeptide (TPR) repeat protein
MKPFLTNFLILTLGFFLVSFSQIDADLDEAYSQFLSTEKASTPAERALFLNRALATYQKVDYNKLSAKSQGWYWYNLGNLYFELGEYPLAVLFYERSLNLLPREEIIKNNLTLAQQKLNPPPSINHSFISSLIKKLAVWEYMQWFGIFTILTFIMISLYIWINRRIFVIGSIVVLSLTFLFIIGAIFRHYGTPVQGIIIHPTLLYRGPSQNYLPADPDPILSGSKVDILEIKGSGLWFKVQTEDNEIGYIRSRDIGTI